MDSKLRHTLEAMIDSETAACIPMLRRDGLVIVTIRNVEAAGLWIENKDLGIGVRSSPDQAFEPLEGLPPTVCFIPWPQIAYVLAGDVPSLRKSQLLHFTSKPAGEST